MNNEPENDRPDQREMGADRGDSEAELDENKKTSIYPYSYAKVLKVVRAISGLGDTKTAREIAKETNIDLDAVRKILKIIAANDKYYEKLARDKLNIPKESKFGIQISKRVKSDDPRIRKRFKRWGFDIILYDDSTDSPFIINILDAKDRKDTGASDNSR